MVRQRTDSDDEDQPGGDPSSDLAGEQAKQPKKSTNVTGRTGKGRGRQRSQRRKLPTSQTARARTSGSSREGSNPQSPVQKRDLTDLNQWTTEEILRNIRPEKIFFDSEDESSKYTTTEDEEDDDDDDRQEERKDNEEEVDEDRDVSSIGGETSDDDEGSEEPQECAVPVRKTTKATANTNPGRGNPKIIGRNEFDHDRQVTIEYVKKNFGARAARASRVQLEKMVDDTNKLKDKVMDHMRSVVERLMVEVARKEPEIKDPSIKGLQVWWASLNPEQQEEMDKQGSAVWRITRPGATDMWPYKWDENEETIFMEKYNIQYRVEGNDTDYLKGCIAKMAGKACRNARKKVFFKCKNNKGGHGIIVSANRLGIVGVKLPPIKRRKDFEFHPQYIRSNDSSYLGDNPSPAMDSGQLDSFVQPAGRSTTQIQQNSVRVSVGPGGVRVSVGPEANVANRRNGSSMRSSMNSGSIGSSKTKNKNVSC